MLLEKSSDLNFLYISKFLLYIPIIIFLLHILPFLYQKYQKKLFHSTIINYVSENLKFKFFKIQMFIEFFFLYFGKMQHLNFLKCICIPENLK